MRGKSNLRVLAAGVALLIVPCVATQSAVGDPTVTPGDGSVPGLHTKAGQSRTGSVLPSAPPPAGALRTVNCGPQDGPAAIRTGACAALLTCPPENRNFTRVVDEQLIAGVWNVIGARCTQLAERAQLTLADLYAEFEKRLPVPAIGMAPNAITLVGIETVMWVGTPNSRVLATVTLLGYRIELSASVSTVSWDFGDGVRTSTPNPERPYDKRDPCTTATCPQYWGHVYRAKGLMRVTARVTWRGTYRINGGPSQTVPQLIPGLAAATNLDVHEARAVLVPHK